jgi:protein SCO1/2
MESRRPSVESARRFGLVRDSIKRCITGLRAAIVCGLLLSICVPSLSRAAGPVHEHQHAGAHQTDVLRQTVAHYVVPDVLVTRMDGSRVHFSRELDDMHPVILNFIYTSCTAICPMTTQVFSSLQEKLGPGLARAKMVSVSIDPEFDTPTRLSAYAGTFHAQPSWQFYTGPVSSSILIQKAFGVYRGDKMNHTPVTFFRQAGSKDWVRLEGLATPDELLNVYNNLPSSS